MPSVDMFARPNIKGAICQGPVCSRAFLIGTKSPRPSGVFLTCDSQLSDSSHNLLYTLLFSCLFGRSTQMFISILNLPECYLVTPSSPSQNTSVNTVAEAKTLETACFQNLSQIPLPSIFPSGTASSLPEPLTFFLTGLLLFILYSSCIPFSTQPPR